MIFAPCWIFKLSPNSLLRSKITKIDKWRHLANRNEIRVPGSTMATNVAVILLFFSGWIVGIVAEHFVAVMWLFVNVYY